MLRLAVKTLAGGTEVVVEVPESSTVTQLKIQLAEKDGRFKGCRLLLHVSYRYCSLRMKRSCLPRVCAYTGPYRSRWAIVIGPIGPDQGKGCYWCCEMIQNCFIFS